MHVDIRAQWVNAVMATPFNSDDIIKSNGRSLI